MKSNINEISSTPSKWVYNPLGMIRIAAVINLLVISLGDSIGFFSYASHIDEGLMTDNFFFRFTGLSFPFETESIVVLGKTWSGVYKAFFFGFGILAGLGVFTRVSLLVFASISIYLSAGLAAGHAFNHDTVLTHHLLFILAIVPGVRSFSIDALYYSYRDRKANGSESNSSLARLKAALLCPRFRALEIAEGWGIKLVLLLFFIVYLNAGLSKEILSEGKWWNGDTLGYYLGRSEVDDYWIAKSVDVEPWEEGKPRAHFVDHTYGYETTWIGHQIAQSKLLLVLLSVSSLAWELCPFMLFMRRPYRIFYLFLSCAMHMGIGFTMGLPFISYQAFLLLLVDWPYLLRAIRKRISG